MFPNIDRKVTSGYYATDGRAYWQAGKHFYYTNQGDTTTYELNWKPNTTCHPADSIPNFVILSEACVARDGYLQRLTSDRNQLLVQVYGKDINIIDPQGQVQRLPYTEAYMAECDNIYRTCEGYDKSAHYVYIDPDTGKIRYSFNVKGSVEDDDEGNICVVMPQGVAFIPHKSEEP